ncbi:Fur family transcriptional regulator [Gulosibacter bifidus]|uniref:Fur family transcriptional regulator n=1 Tax=Gulosibacter bifidus TaxID=272239 RepID=A0ABW5RJV2_9MICO|nr:transcriptional repressor [Gulosibacter bifidus]
MNEIPSAGPQRRKTWQRDAVREALAETAEFVSAQELHRILEDRGQRMGLATVYRALGSLHESGEADSLHTADGERYRSCESEAHHHHLVCRNCKATVEIETPDVEVWSRQLVEAHGYTQPSHHLEVFGLCPKCTAETA